MQHTEIGTRFKNYELITEGHLYRRTPVIIRLDGNAFHTFTRSHWGKCWSSDFNQCMSRAVENMMKKIGGAKVAYIQSDEVSILLTDYDTLVTEAWFGYDLSKVISISAGMMSAYFDREMVNYVAGFEGEKPELGNPVWFDSRAFNLPRDEVTNYFIWRQQDCIRNSISFYARQTFSDSELHGKSRREMLTMLDAKGKHWDELPAWMKNGLAVKKVITKDPKFGNILRWNVDYQVPRFSQARNYIEKYVNVDQISPEELAKAGEVVAQGIKDLTMDSKGTICGLTSYGS